MLLKAMEWGIEPSFPSKSWSHCRN